MVNVDQFSNVLLVGFMASGKSAVGQELATLLGWDFSDMDAVIEERYGLPINLLFEKKGQGYFRRIESEVSLDLVSLSSTVLATGGGWALSDQNWKSVPSATFTVWLKVTPEGAFNRAKSDGSVRPLLNGIDSMESLSVLLESRSEWYSRAQCSVDSETGNPNDIAQGIVHLMEKRNSLVESQPGS